MACLLSTQFYRSDQPIAAIFIKTSQWRRNGHFTKFANTIPNNSISLASICQKPTNSRYPYYQRQLSYSVYCPLNFIAVIAFSTNTNQWSSQFDWSASVNTNQWQLFILLLTALLSFYQYAIRSLSIPANGSCLF